MINRLIEFSLKNRFLILLAYALLAVWGYWALLRTPIDAIPDLSENQVIVYTDWTGRSPQEVEDQITYPLTVNLQGLAGVKDVRSSSALGWRGQDHAVWPTVFCDSHGRFWFRAFHRHGEYCDPRSTLDSRAYVLGLSGWASLFFARRSVLPFSSRQGWQRLWSE
jgi:hypothetical protein